MSAADGVAADPHHVAEQTLAVLFGPPVVPLKDRGIGRLIIVDVTLDRGSDDAQMVFESLNSTGVDLTASDLIRNFILMGLPEAQQTELYNNDWAKIEDLFRSSGSIFDSFARDYMALRTKAS